MSHSILGLALLSNLAACTGVTSPVLTSGDGVTGHRVWIDGEWVAAKGERGGLFDAESPAPVTPSITIPASQGETLGSLDLSADGSSLAYVANDAGGAAHVYVAHGDASSPVEVFHQATGIRDLAMAPDGSAIAFLASDSDGLTDVYLLDLAGDTVMKISPDLPTGNAALGMYEPIVWSRTSRYVAFVGSATESDYYELFVVDVGAGLDPVQRSTILSRDQIEAPPLAPGMGANGVVVWPAFDADDRIWYGARVADVTPPPIAWFSSPVAAPDPTHDQVPLPVRSDGTSSEVIALAVSPDGVHVAFVADAPVASSFEMYYASTAQPEHATALTQTIAPSTYWNTPSFSPDGTQIATAIGAANGASNRAPYVIDVGGGPARQLAAIPNGAADDSLIDVSAVQWAAGPSVYCVIERGDGRSPLFRLDPSLVMQTPELVIDVSQAGPLEGVFVFEVR